MQAGVTAVSSNTALAEEAGNDLTHIKDVVSSVMSRVQRICFAAAQMQSSSDNVSRSMADLAAILEESSAGAEQMSVSADEVSASVTTVAAANSLQGSSVDNLIVSASSLSDVSAALSEVIGHFKIEDGAETELQIGTFVRSQHLQKAAKLQASIPGSAIGNPTISASVLPAFTTSLTASVDYYYHIIASIRMLTMYYFLRSIHNSRACGIGQ